MIIHDVPEKTVVVDIDDQGPSPIRIVVTGDLDLSGGDALTAAIETLPDLEPVELDLGGVDFMDSSGVRALVWCHNDRRTTVVDPSRAVLRICELARVQHLLEQR